MVGRHLMVYTKSGLIQEIYIVTRRIPAVISTSPDILRLHGDMDFKGPVMREFIVTSIDQAEGDREHSGLHPGSGSCHGWERSLSE